VEAKGFVKRSIVDEYRKEGEDVEEMGLKESMNGPSSWNQKLT
jgi:hypothetical protein